MPQLQYKNQTIEYTHLVKPHLKHAYIEIKSTGVIFKSPPMSAKKVKLLLEKKAPWILKKIKACPPPQPLSHNSFYLMGQKHSIKGVEPKENSESQVYLKGKTLWIHAPFKAQDDFFQAFLKKEALAFIEERLDDWADEMGLHPKKVRYKKLKSRYGSCSSLGSINLNYLMIQLPVPIIDSILVHELAHLKHLNHSSDFWNLVYEYIPNYKELDHDLKYIWQSRLLF